MTYAEMTSQEWKAISARIGGKEGWRKYYWAGSPAWWHPWASYKFHTSDQSRWLRQACKTYGGFDPLYPIYFEEQ